MSHRVSDFTAEIVVSLSELLEQVWKIKLRKGSHNLAYFTLTSQAWRSWPSSIMPRLARTELCFDGEEWSHIDDPIERRKIQKHVTAFNWP